MLGIVLVFCQMEEDAAHVAPLRGFGLEEGGHAALGTGLLGAPGKQLLPEGLEHEQAKVLAAGQGRRRGKPAFGIGRQGNGGKACSLGFGIRFGRGHVAEGRDAGRAYAVPEGVHGVCLRGAPGSQAEPELLPGLVLDAVEAEPACGCQGDVLIGLGHGISFSRRLQRMPDRGQAL